MKMNEIRKSARNNGVKGYFQSLYEHSIRAVESLAKEDIENVFKHCRKIEAGTYGDDQRADIYGDVYAFWICNGNDGIANTLISVDVMYGDPCGAQMEENFSVHSPFDYRGLSMVIFFDEKSDTVMFERYFNGNEGENFEFLKGLTDSKQLNMIFGKYLVKNEGKYDENHPDDAYVCFSVSIKFFED